MTDLNKEGLSFVKLMMLLSSFAPLFILVGIRGMDEIINYLTLWIIIIALIAIPFGVLILRVYSSEKEDDKYKISVKNSRLNKEYLFIYLFTVLFPIYSVSITNQKELIAILFAIAFVVFVLWNLNMHFINIFFALKGYKVYTLPQQNSAILLTTRSYFDDRLKNITAHRLSNSVFIELKDYNYE